MITILPKTKLGNISLVLIALMPVLFMIGGVLARTLYSGVGANSIIEDLWTRPFLAIGMLLGIASGVLAFFVAAASFVKDKERAILVYIPLVIGALLLLFIFGELIFQH